MFFKYMDRIKFIDKLIHSTKHATGHVLKIE